MRNRKTYEAFTLVEMLIVMGIIIILMGVGITAGRFAINRANDVAHQNAVDQIYQALQAYYTNEREFPAAATPQALLEEEGALAPYLDSGAFDGGTDATYLYWVQSGQQQEAMVCVSLGGEADEKNRGVYCNGNSFGGEFVGGAVTEKSITTEIAGAANPAYTGLNGAGGTLSDWETDGGWTTAGAGITPA
jgi:type II secretory pathway pseudopilin PulG